ncbi:MAG: 50S ribosomal protein L17 [Flavobacteriales bacterium]|nr:50S ribosomal protein L17 [Flavobacteriales bacterium]
MRHGKKFNHLSRKAPHRKAMLANMASSLLMHKRINTTVAKAKALKVFIEPLLTKSKDDSTHSRRMVFRYLRDKYAVTELFRDVAPKIANRPGGYTRILKTGNRLGDNAEMCMIELVDFNEVMLAEPKSEGAAEKKPRTRRGKKKSDAPKATAKAETKEESKPVVEDAEIIEEEVKEDVSAEASEKSETSEAEPEAKAEEETTDESSEAKTEEEATAEVEESPEEEVEETKEETSEEKPEDDASEEDEEKKG